MKKIIGWVLFGAVGLALATSCFATAGRGLSQSDQDAYRRALDLQPQMDALGFDRFQLADYPVAFYDGNRDYVVTEDGVTSRSPVLSTFAGTALEVDGNFEVLLPTRERMREMLSLLGSAFAGVNPASDEYSEGDHVATIWHEGFHAYQFTRFSGQLEQLQNGNAEALITRDIDSDPWQVQQLGQSLDALKQALTATDHESLLAAVRSFIETESARRNALPDDARTAEEQLWLIEGTAYYVECAARGKTPLDGVNASVGGSYKYYQMGAAMCEVLDALDPNWKRDFDFSRNLSALLQEKAG